MKRTKRDKELTDTIPQLIPHAEPNTESLEAIHESDAFFSRGGGFRRLRQRRRPDRCSSKSP